MPSGTNNQQQEPRTCGCGCGERTNGSEFKQGHGWQHRKDLLHQMAEGSIAAFNELSERDWIRINTFGVEIECLLPQNRTHLDVVNHLMANGIRIRDAGYTHEVTTDWKIVTDSSVHGPGYIGIEVVSPVLKGKKGLAEMRKVMKILHDELGCRVNRNCGFHVHIGARRLNVAKLQRLLDAYDKLEPSLDSLVAPSRRNGNGFCRSIRETWGSERVSTWRLGSIDRYCKLNLKAYPKYGTVEFRQHQGTLEGPKAEAWIHLVTTMVERANTAEWTPPYGEHIENELNLSPKRKAYLQQRRQTLSRRAAA